MLFHHSTGVPPCHEPARAYTLYQVPYVTVIIYGSYNLEKVLNFGSRLEKSFNLVKVLEKSLKNFKII